MDWLTNVRQSPEEKILELGGGENRHSCANVNVDVRSGEGIDFVADFNSDLPIQSGEWDTVICVFCLEHICYRNVPKFLSEVNRILKVGGRFLFITANTEKQLKWIQEHQQEGWDTGDVFVDSSCMLFGGNDYSENTHRSYFSQSLLTDLLNKAGFSKITLAPFGASSTDVFGQAYKMEAQQPVEAPKAAASEAPKSPQESLQMSQKILEQVPPEKQPMYGAKSTEDRAALYDRDYFNGGLKVGGYANEGYWDFPPHEITFRHIMIRHPESVLELGCARGYIVKRLEDAGVRTIGYDISDYCMETRVASGAHKFDLCNDFWPDADKSYDLVFSISVLEHVPEEFLPQLMEQIKRVGKRGLHGIEFDLKEGGFDRTKVTFKSKEWWQSILPEGHEVVNKNDLESGPIPTELLLGDGTLKLNLGSNISMFYGWMNLDIQELTPFAQSYGYKFQRADLCQGVPFGTESVSAIFCSYLLDSLSYRDALSLLRECRRVLRPDSAMRIVVPDSYKVLYAGLDKTAYKRFDTVFPHCDAADTALQKMHAMLHTDRKTFWDEEILGNMLTESGFTPKPATFRNTESPLVKKILKETRETLPALSLYMDAFPVV